MAVVDLSGGAAPGGGQGEQGNVEIGPILTRLKALEESNSKVSQVLGVQAEAMIKQEGNPLTALLAVDVADRAEAKLVNSGLFKSARTALAVVLPVCVLMLGGSVTYFSVQISSVHARAEAAMSSIQALATDLQSRAGNVDSLARLVTTHLAILNAAMTESASSNIIRVRNSSAAAIESLRVFTRRGHDSLNTALAAITAMRKTALTRFNDSSAAAFANLRVSTRSGQDSLAIALAAIGAMRDTALRARLSGRDSMTIRIDVRPRWLTLLEGLAVLLALAALLVAVWPRRSRRAA